MHKIKNILYVFCCEPGKVAGAGDTVGKYRAAQNTHYTKMSAFRLRTPLSVPRLKENGSVG